MNQTRSVADARYKILRTLLELASGGSAIVAGGAVQEIRFAIGTAAAQTSTTTIPEGAIVIDAELDIRAAYSPGTTMQVGILGTPNLLMDTPDSVPTSPELYAEHQDTAWPASGKVLLTVGGAPVAGSGFCIVRYVSAPLP